MSKEKKIICIKCPRGCEVATTVDGYSIGTITGNACKLGNEYVKNEINDPRRTVTSTVRVKNGNHSLVPVWTEEPIPKDKIFDLMKSINEIELNAPIDINQVIIKNYMNLGINVITSGRVMKKI